MSDQTQSRMSSIEARLQKIENMMHSIHQLTRQASIESDSANLSSAPPKTSPPLYDQSDPSFSSMDARRAVQYAHDAEARAEAARRSAIRALSATRSTQHDPLSVLSTPRSAPSPFGVQVD